MVRKGPKGWMARTRWQVSPDGKHVYATGMADDALAVFALGDLYRLFMPLALR